MATKKIEKQLTELNDYTKTGYIDNTPCVVTKVSSGHYLARAQIYPEILGEGSTEASACNNLIQKVINFEGR